ncbi:hypothetical protein [Rhodopirellula sp. MGV]|uniref:hypothetical protein n=1 Tax=Rhodopirellula sp. MGV TaxID=2023130 RepID=UPI000B97B0EB|nr:hypothetical protein [Rhodopirellula sp. MGV]OYP36820.1 hypothetical protein CGZ80_07170 [Rhodopirellula sp. MGV]PNY36473.1 hypothetical protein C2E31_12810 [Rhodopirellula baltica]
MSQHLEAVEVGPVPEHLRPALASLLTANIYAEQSDSCRWDFAVEIEQLSSLALVPNDFRWLVRNGLVEHQREITLENDNGRSFRKTGDLTFAKRTCFVLTDKGIRCAAGIAAVPKDILDLIEQPLRRQTTAVSNSAQKIFPISKLPTSTPSPQWDSERRVLHFRGAIVKHFKWVAHNQQAVLNAFEEDGWPPRIDDPLPGQPEQDSKRRLSDTIKCLNRKQLHPLIHFRGDGTGEGVIWELTRQQVTDRPTTK